MNLLNGNGLLLEEKLTFKTKFSLAVKDISKKAIPQRENKSRNASYSNPTKQNKSNQMLNNQKIMFIKRNDGFANEIKFKG